MGMFFLINLKKLLGKKNKLYGKFQLRRICEMVKTHQEIMIQQVGLILFTKSANGDHTKVFLG